MLKGCPSCGLTDQVKSIRQILGIKNEATFTEFRGASIQPGEAQVQPVVGYTQINPDPNLTTLQKKLAAYTAIPWRPSLRIVKMYRSYIRTSVGGSMLIASGVVTLIFFGLGLIPLYFGIRLYRKSKPEYAAYIQAFNAEREEYLFSNPEYLRKINGWYCQRCGVTYSND
jgi:hypothetical protein